MALKAHTNWPLTGSGFAEAPDVPAQRPSSLRLYTVAQAAALMGIPVSSLYRLTAGGAVPVTRLAAGGRVYLRATELDAYLTRQTATPPAETTTGADSPITFTGTRMLS